VIFIAGIMCENLGRPRPPLQGSPCKVLPPCKVIIIKCLFDSTNLLFSQKT